MGFFQGRVYSVFICVLSIGMLVFLSQKIIAASFGSDYSWTMARVVTVTKTSGRNMGAGWVRYEFTSDGQLYEGRDKLPLLGRFRRDPDIKVFYKRTNPNDNGTVIGTIENIVTCLAAAGVALIFGFIKKTQSN